jgi:hypothetical protein
VRTPAGSILRNSKPPRIVAESARSRVQASVGLEGGQPRQGDRKDRADPGRDAIDQEFVAKAGWAYGDHPGGCTLLGLADVPGAVQLDHAPATVAFVGRRIAIVAEQDVALVELTVCVGPYSVSDCIRVRGEASQL